MNTYHRAPLGLAFGWQFDFAMEIQLGSFSGSPSSPSASVTLLTPDGSGYDFVLQSDGTWRPSAVSGAVPHEYKLEFVGTLPAALADIRSMSTEWRLTNSHDRVWTLKTVSDVNARPARFNIGRPTLIDERDGYSWELTYTTDGALSSITDSFGRAATFVWHKFYITALPNVAGSRPFPEAIKEITFPDGTKATYIYDPAPAASPPSTSQIQRLVGVQWKDASDTVVDSVTYHYEDSDFPRSVTGVTDHRSVRIATYAYDGVGRAISTEGADGANKFTVSYATSGSLVTRTVTNPLGRTDIYKYTKLGSSGFNIRSAGVDGQASPNCPASAKALTYDSNGYVASRTDEEGRVTTYVNDSRGRPTLVTEATGLPEERQTTITWHATLDTPVTIQASGLTSVYTYNTAGQLTSLTQTDTTTHLAPYSTNGQTRTWSYTYTTDGLVTSIDGSLPGASDTVSYTYDAAGYLATYTDAIGNVTTVNAVNGSGQPTVLVDANTLVTQLTFDAKGQLTAKVDDPSGISSRTEMEYDNAGNVVKLTSPDGSVLDMEYDGANRVVSVTNALGDKVTYAYDDMGNRTSEQFSSAAPQLFFEHTRTFDELGRLLQVIGEGPATWNFGYDKVGNPTTVTDPSSEVATSAYDGLNRLIAFTDERTSTTAMSYTHTDKPTTITDPRSVVTSYVRNGWGEAIQEKSNDIGTTVYVRNQSGDITQRTDARGIVTTYSYDNAGRIATRTYPSEPASNVTLSYDSVASGNAGKGRLTGVTDAAGTVSYFYDMLGRAVQETRSIGSQTYTIGYSWDDAGNLIGITYPSGRVVEYGRGTTGQIEQVRTSPDTLSPPTDVVLWTAYTPFGPRMAAALGNELREGREYDLDGRITGVSVEDQVLGQDLIRRSLQYQDKRNLTAIEDQVNPANTETFTYTDNGFLATANGPWGTLNYTIDGVGNIAQRTVTVGGVTSVDEYSTPGNSNRLTGIITDGVPSRSFQSDWAGNVIEDATVTPAVTKTYIYNAAGQLSDAAQGGTPRGTYVYDYLSRLVSRTIHSASVTLHRVHDLDGNVIAEYDGSGTLLTEYIWIDGRPLAVVADAGTPTPDLYYVLTDHLERPLMMADQNRDIVWQASYLPFGEVRTITGPASLDYRFPGQWFQLETGLHYNWHRHYDPSTGRYLQPDPLGMPEGPSRWAYVANSPLMKVDPEGLESPVTSVARSFGFPVPQPLGYDPPEPIPNYCTARNWTCEASCNQQIIDPSVTPVPGGRLYGIGTGPSQPQACLAAKRAATQSAPRGSYARHCQCYRCSQ